MLPVAGEADRQGLSSGPTLPGEAYQRLAVPGDPTKSHEPLYRGDCGRVSFAETLCDKVLRLIRTTDVKLGETLSLQLRQHEEIEALVREFGKEFGTKCTIWDTALINWKPPWTT